MRIHEIASREDFLPILLATLETMWTEQLGSSIHCSKEPITGGHAWHAQSLLSGIYTPDLAAPARRFLADLFRFTNVRSRMLPQYLLGSLLASPLGLRTTGRPLFWSSLLPLDTSQLLIIPGNQRLRIFDFQRGVVRVQLKQGSHEHTLRTEIEVRSTPVPGNLPFPPVLDVAPSGRSLIEPLIHGYSLARCPPWRNREALTRKAIDMLHAWLELSSHSVAADKHLEQLEANLEEMLNQLRNRFGDRNLLCSTCIAPLVEAASSLGRVVVSQSHGDFQAGNVLIQRGTQRVFLIDWEFSARRMVEYDLLVFGLHSRFHVGRRERWACFTRSGVLKLPRGVNAPHTRSRLGLMALFLLEELAWRLLENTAGPFSDWSPSMIAFDADLSDWVSTFLAKEGTIELK